MERIRHSWNDYQDTSWTPSKVFAQFSATLKNWTNSRVKLSPFRRPYFTYWTVERPSLNGGAGYFQVLGGPKLRQPQVWLPYEFPSHAVARSVARYMTRTSRRRKFVAETF